MPSSLAYISKEGTWEFLTLITHLKTVNTREDILMCATCHSPGALQVFTARSAATIHS